MKKLFLVGLIFMLSMGVCFAGNQWREGGTEQSIAGSESPSDIDEVSYENIVAPIHRMFANYREGAKIVYASASTLTVEDGEVMLSNSTGTIRLMQQNTSDTTVSWSDLDTGSEAASTTYYIYAYQDTVATTTFSIKISLSSSAPTGVTYYKRLGSFYNDGDSNITGIQNDNSLAIASATAKSFDTEYRATRNGWVTGYITCTETTEISRYVDVQIDDTTIQRVGNSAHTDSDVTTYYSFCVPVPTGSKYEANLTNATGSAIYFVPME